MFKPRSAKQAKPPAKPPAHCDAARTPDWPHRHAHGAAHDATAENGCGCPQHRSPGTPADPTRVHGQRSGRRSPPGSGLPATMRAASAVDEVGSCRASGRCWANQPLHWASACGWESTSVTLLKAHSPAERAESAAPKPCGYRAPDGTTAHRGSLSPRPPPSSRSGQRLHHNRPPASCSTTDQTHTRHELNILEASCSINTRARVACSP